MSADQKRERDVTAAFVAVAGSLATGYDVAEMLSELTQRCARLLDIASAGLLLADPRGTLHVLAASSERTRQLEVFQVQRDQGPCRDCYRDGAPVSVADLSDEDALDRWPQFVPIARQGGFASVHAVPMRLREDVLGVLGLFGTTPGALNADDLSLAQALADVASVALIQDSAAADTATVATGLQAALTGRVRIEQAKGMLARSGDLDTERAGDLMKHYAQQHDERLSQVATHLVTRTLHPQDVLDRTARIPGGRAATKPAAHDVRK